MKKFISKNWKWFLIIVGIVFLVLSIFNKIIVKKNLLNDYIMYGKDIPNPGYIEKISDKVDNETSNFSNASVSSSIVQYTVVFGVAILAVIFITSIGSSSGDKGKKK